MPEWNASLRLAFDIYINPGMIEQSLEVWQQLTTAENIVVKVAQVANISPTSVMQGFIGRSIIVGAWQVY